MVSGRRFPVFLSLDKAPIKGGGITRSATLVQEGIEPDRLEANNPSAVAADATSAKFTISANVAWEAAEETDVDWITGIAPAEGDGDGEVTVTITANAGDTERRGNILITQKEGELSKTVKITQKGLASGITIDDLVGSYAVSEGIFEEEAYPGQTSSLEITKVNDTEVTISGIFRDYFQDYDGFAITATYDSTKEELSMGAQKVEPSLMKPEYETWFVGQLISKTDYEEPATGKVTNDGGIKITVKAFPPEMNDPDNIGFFVCAKTIATGTLEGWAWYTFDTEWTKQGACAPAMGPVKENVTPQSGRYNFLHSSNTAKYVR